MGDIELGTLGDTTPGDTTPGDTTPGESTQVGSRKWEYFATAACLLVSFKMGSVVGWISPTVMQILAPKRPDQPCILSDISIQVAVGATGYILAPLMINTTVNKLGRKGTLLLCGFPLFISSVLVITTTNSLVGHFARVCDKFVLATCISVTPMYLGEIAPADRRGASVSSMGLAMNTGLLFSYGTGLYMWNITEGAIRMSIAFTFVVIFWFMPESPYFLVLRGRMADAKAVLEKLRGKTDVHDELNAIKESMPQSDDPSETNPKLGGIDELFATTANRRAIIIASLFIIPQNCGGFFSILVLFYKSRSKFLSSPSALVGVAIAWLISAMLVKILIDKLGRKPLIIASGAIAGLANLTIACYLFMKNGVMSDVSESSPFFYIVIFIQIVAFYCGLISTHDVIKSEIFAIEVKAIGVCICCVLGEFFSVSAAEVITNLIVRYEKNGFWIAYLVWALLVWGFTIVITIVTPETKGKTFVQIQQRLDS